MDGRRVETRGFPSIDVTYRPPRIASAVLSAATPVYSAMVRLRQSIE